MSHIRIALTFDGGPDGLAANSPVDLAKRYNTTERILEALQSHGIPGVGPIKAAFFVQTHVPSRMAWPTTGPAPGEADFTTGQKLVRRMGEAGHVVGVLNGSEKDFDRHLEQAAGSAPNLEANLNRAVAALKAVLPRQADSSPYDVEFVRSPFGLHDAASDAVYDRLNLTHVFWDTQAANLPLGDLCPGVSNETKWNWLINRVRKQAESTMRRRIKHHTATPEQPEPAPLLVVVQLHDISAVTAAYLPAFLLTLLEAEAADHTSGAPEIPIRFCATTEEVAECLRGAPPGASNIASIDNALYDPRPRLAVAYDTSEDINLQLWDMIKTELWVNHLYRDGYELVTAGVGRLVDIPGKHKAEDVDRLVLPLPLHHKGATLDDPKPATDADKIAARNKLKASTKVPKQRPARTKPKVAGVSLDDRLKACLVESDGLFLFESDTLALLDEDRRRLVDVELTDVLRDYGIGQISDLPPPVRLALADMIFNMGPGNKDKTSGLRAYKRMFADIKSWEWERAALKSERDKEEAKKNRGIRERNAATAELFIATALLENAPLPVFVVGNIGSRITHPTAETVRIDPTIVTLKPDEGWMRDGPISWQVWVEYPESGRHDKSELIVGQSNALSWEIDFGTMVRGGLMRLEIEANVKHSDGRSKKVTLRRSGPIRAQNPSATDVRKMLENEVPPPEVPEDGPELPAFLLRAIAYHATTRETNRPSATAYRPFDTQGQPVAIRLKQASKVTLFPYFGLMRLPLRDAEADLLWHWRSQVAAAQQRLAAAIACATNDQAGYIKFDEDQFLRQVLNYYGYAGAPEYAPSYYRQGPGHKKRWVEGSTALRPFVTELCEIVENVEAGTPPIGWTL